MSYDDFISIYIELSTANDAISFHSPLQMGVIDLARDFCMNQLVNSLLLKKNTHMQKATSLFRAPIDYAFFCFRHMA